MIGLGFGFVLALRAISGLVVMIKERKIFTLESSLPSDPGIA
jgi:hypothetical protein